MTDITGSADNSPEAPKNEGALRKTASEKRAELLADSRAESQADTEVIAPAHGPIAADGTRSLDSSPKRASLGVVAAVAAAAVIGGVSGAGVSLWAVGASNNETTSVTPAPTTITVNDPDNATNITAVAASAAASVVTISVSTGDGAGTGSGVVLDDDGYILTNTHVITLSGTAADPQVTVQTTDGRLLSAEIIGTDPIADLAVIKVDAATDLPAIEFADSSKLNVGDSAIAIGAPLGLPGTVTDGIISSLNRSIQIASSAAPEDAGDAEGHDSTPEDPFDFWQFDIPGQESAPASSSTTISIPVIQTDAAINPGNSGGALLDSDGKLIGINVAIASAGTTSAQSGNIGVGFAIPANLAKRVAGEIIESGSATHGLLGAAVLDVTEDEDAVQFGFVGALIKEITAGGAADNAGLEPGDIVTKFNGIPIQGKTDLTAQVRALPAGAEAALTYVRDGDTEETTVTLGKLQV